MVAWFASGEQVELSDETPFAEHLEELERVPGLMDLADRHWGGGDEERAFGAELILEGLHQHLKVARQDLDSRISYKEMVKFQLLKPKRRAGRGGGPQVN
jgi:hypothetical protein